MALPSKFEDLGGEGSKPADAAQGNVRPLARHDEEGPWHRRNATNTVLVLALSGYCFAFFPTLSILLNELVKQGRFLLGDIGTAYTLLVLSQAGACLLYGMRSKQEGSKGDIFWSFILIAALFLVMAFASGHVLLALIALLGLPIGVMLSVATAGLVGFGSHAVRMQGFLAIIMRVLQLSCTLIVSLLILPYFATAGGFSFLALLYLGSAFVWLLLHVPRPAPVRTEKQAGRFGMGLRGAAGLIAALLIFGGRGALVPYVVPLGEAAGLHARAAQQGMSIFIAGQVVGAVLIATFAFGSRYIATLTAALIVILVSSSLCAFGSSMPTFYLGLFILAVALSFKDVFVLPMLMSADPTHRAAIQMGTASLFGEAIGPLATTAILAPVGVRGSLLTCGGMILAGMFFVYGIEVSKGRRRK